MCSSISNEARDKRHLRHQLKVTYVSYDECALALDSSPPIRSYQSGSSGLSAKTS